jgi:dTDP-4-amino-4,6-dideoxygalactose transaminase
LPDDANTITARNSVAPLAPPPPATAPASAPVLVPMADLQAQYRQLKNEIDQAALGVLASGGFILGDTLAELERRIARVCGVRHGIGVNNGTDALLLSLMALDIGPGDEVITTPFTFVATVETIALLGAVPVFADIDPVTFNLDPQAVARKISPRTRAILPVHLFGQMADMGALSALAAEHDLPLIADAAQAIGCAQEGRLVGEWSHLTTLSFYPTKNLGAAGDGGMVLTDDDHLAEKLRYLRFHGSKGTYQYRYVGICSRLDALQAAICRSSCRIWPPGTASAARTPPFTTRRLPAVRPDSAPHAARKPAHLSPVHPARAGAGPARGAQGVFGPAGRRVGRVLSRRASPPGAYLHLGGMPGDFPEAERACREVLSLPIVPELSSDQRDLVAASVRDFFECSEF